MFGSHGRIDVAGLAYDLPSYFWTHPWRGPGAPQLLGVRFGSQARVFPASTLHWVFRGSQLFGAQRRVSPHAKART